MKIEIDPEVLKYSLIPLSKSEKNILIESLNFMIYEQQIFLKEDPELEKLLSKLEELK